MLTQKKILTIYYSAAALLTLASFYLCFLEIQQENQRWDAQQQTLSLKQRNDWQQTQAQIHQHLLVSAQPLLLDSVLIASIKSQSQTPYPSAELIQGSHSSIAPLYAALEPYRKKMHQQGVSELSLHFASGFSLLQIEKRAWVSDNPDSPRPELQEVFTSGKTAGLFAASRQGTAYRLLIPIADEQLNVLAVIELARRLEHQSSSAALLHKHLVDKLLWDEVRKQMHPTLVGNWRLEATTEPIASWWQQGLVAAEKQQQQIKTDQGIFLLSWIDHSTRRLAMLVWRDISADYRLHQQQLQAGYTKWLMMLIGLQLMLWSSYKLLMRQQQHLMNQYQEYVALEHHQLEQSHARLALALRSSNSGFWEWNIVTNRMRFSPEWRQLLKMPPGEDEMSLDDWVSVLDPNHRRNHHADMMNHLKGLTPMFENEYRVKTGDGGFRWILSRGKVIERDASGRAVFILGVYTDVTDKKETELISVRQQAALQTLNEITSLPVHDVDEQLRRALILAAKYLGVTTTGISDIHKKDYRLRVYVDVRGKTHIPYVALANTYCSLVIAKNQILAEDNIPQSDYANHSAFTHSGHESYIGAPITINGVAQGTLFFSAPKSRGREYDQLDKDFVQLLARWAAAVIDSSLRDQEKKIIIDRFKKLSEHLPGFLYQYQLCPDGSSFYPYASPGIYNIYGVTPEDVAQTAEKILDLIHPDDLGWIAETVSYSASSLTPWIATVRVNNPHRGLVWTHVQSIPEQLEDGSILWHGYVSDITALKNTELKLERANAMHQAILDAASVSIITTDTQGTIKTFNRGAELMLGYSPDEMIDKQSPEKIHTQHEIIARANLLSEQCGYQIKPGFDVFIAKAKEGEDDEAEWTYLRKDGTAIPVLLTVSALRNTLGDITGYLGIARDISQLKRIDKMKNEFVSTVSHELRTPLTSISGALGLVVNGLAGSLPEQAAKMIQIAHNNSLRLIYLVNDLLDMEKLLAGEMKFELQLHSMMALIKRSIDANAAYAAQFNVIYVIDEQADDAKVYVDAERIQQVMANFLSNAAKFSPEHSTVSIKCQSKLGRVRVYVEDNGPGIPEEFRHRIFQKFSQADSSDTRQKGGTGLGLAICKEIVERMGGKIGFHSIVGHGASFFFDFPVEPLVLAPLLSSESEKQKQQESILVVEDEEDFAEYLKNLFESRGFRVDIAINGNQALACLELRHYDLVTLDLFLPDMNGTEILKDIRSREDRLANEFHDANNLAEKINKSPIPTPIIIISTNPDDGKKRISDSLREAKGIYWIQKPLAEGEPLLTVNYALLLAKKALES